MTPTQRIMAQRCYEALIEKLPWLEALEVNFKDAVMQIRVMHCYPVDPSESVEAILNEAVSGVRINLAIQEVPQGFGRAVRDAVEGSQESCDCEVCRGELN